MIIDKVRDLLARDNALVTLSVFSIFIGLFVGMTIVAFRLLIEYLSGLSIGSEDAEAFETLPPWLRFCLPLLGGVVLGLLLHWLYRGRAPVGVTHVIERLNYHRGHLPFQHAITQFFAGAISIASGHSVGREGPGVHLGAAWGSLLGDAFSLPRNSVRVFIACGVAAAIGASFNTPLAGVIFAMEVVLMEYTVATFTPVILSAVIATVMAQLVFGSQPEIIVPSIPLASHSELLCILFSGVLIGVLAVLFIRLTLFCQKQTLSWPVLQSCSVAGLLCGVIAVFVPEVMGLGYDTVNHAILGQYGAMVLVMIVFAKVLATAICIGGGLPGGIIGPTFVIGATAGAVLGLGVESLYTDIEVSFSLYAMVGMAAMMAATLQAPLAALMALLELTANPNIILPGMLAVISATLTASQLLKSRSVFHEQLSLKGLKKHYFPIKQVLERVGVAAVMNRDLLVVAELNDSVSPVQLENCTWIFFKNSSSLLMTKQYQQIYERYQSEETDLLPALEQYQVKYAEISDRATLHEAKMHMDEQRVDVLIVIRGQNKPWMKAVGVIARREINQMSQSF